MARALTGVGPSPNLESAANLGFAESLDWGGAQGLPRGRRIWTLTDKSAAADFPLFANCGNVGEGDERRFFSHFLKCERRGMAAGSVKSMAVAPGSIAASHF